MARSLCTDVHGLYTGWPEKVSHYQIVLKSANQIRFQRQIKEMIKHYNMCVGIKYFLRDLLFGVNGHIW